MRRGVRVAAYDVAPLAFVAAVWWAGWSRAAGEGVSRSAGSMPGCVAQAICHALTAIGRFPGRRTAIVVLNGFMGLPPVVVGLVVYLLLSRSGPLGSYGLLFTPTAMVIAQTLLIAPIVAALTRQVIEDAWSEYQAGRARESLLGLGTR